MNDSQNKQGEQAHAISNTPRSDAAAYCTIPSSCSTDFARQLERELNTAQSILSQQHAPPKEVEERMEELLNKYFPHTAWGGNVRTLARYLMTELATELTKRREEERVKHEAQLKAVKEDRDAILDDRDSLRQQLAEAKSEQSRLQSKLKADVTEQLHAKAELRAHNIALSAVVEKMRGVLQQCDWLSPSVGTPPYKTDVEEVLALQPDLSLYGRVCSLLKDAERYLRGEGFTSLPAEITQLLADLGQGK